MKHIFIINQNILKKEDLINLKYYLANICYHKKLDFLIVTTKSREEATSYVNEFSKIENAVLYAVGGDGTVNSVIQKIDKDTPLGIIPIGKNNNSFKNCYGIDDCPVEYLINDSNNTIKVNTGICNNERFLSSVSTGLLQELTDRERKKLLLQKLQDYIVVKKHKSKEIELSYYDYRYSYIHILREIKGNLSSIMVNNGLYGENKKIVSTVSYHYNPNFLDLAIIKELDQRKLREIAHHLRNDSLQLSKDIIHIPTDSITLASKNMISYTIDGEYKKASCITINSCPKSLTLKKQETATK